MAIGRYPIPPPDPKEIDKLFSMDPRSIASSLVSSIRLPPGVRPPSGANDGARPMAIFELLDYIVNEVSTVIPHGQIHLECNIVHMFILSLSNYFIMTHCLGNICMVQYNDNSMYPFVFSPVISL
jgi:hypothetical protein